MKEHQIAAVYNHENPEMLGMASMMGGFPLSSMVDNILLLNWVELGNRFRLGLSVAKMRANAVNRMTHEVEVYTGRGMTVLPHALPAPTEHHHFSQYAGLISRAPERRRYRMASDGKDSAEPPNQ